MTTKLWPHQFADSGKRISVRKVSYNLTSDLRRKFPPPAVPTIKVQYENGAVDEPNPNDPEYKIALRGYSIGFEARIRELLVKRGIVYSLTEADRQEVAALRADLKSMDVELPETDLEVFVFRICISTPQEYKELVEAISMRSNITEEGRQQALESFRTDLQVSSGESANI